MIIKNKAQLNKHLMEKCALAVANAEEKIYEEMAGRLDKFYSEFKPEEYIRTGELFNSLESTGVMRTGNTISAEVGFNTPRYAHGWVPLQSGGYGYSSWDDETILNVVMTGSYSGLPHGGYKGGTAIWNETMTNLGGRSGIKDLLRQELKKQGL